jgi:hypothetical protein
MVENGKNWVNWVKVSRHYNDDTSTHTHTKNIIIIFFATRERERERERDLSEWDEKMKND